MFLITKRCSFTLKGEDASSSETGASAVAVVSGFIISQLARPSGNTMACNRVSSMNILEIS